MAGKAFVPLLLGAGAVALIVAGKKKSGNGNGDTGPQAGDVVYEGSVLGSGGIQAAIPIDYRVKLIVDDAAPYVAQWKMQRWVNWEFVGKYAELEEAIEAAIAVIEQQPGYGD